MPPSRRDTDAPTPRPVDLLQHAARDYGATVTPTPHSIEPVDQDAQTPTAWASFADAYSRAADVDQLTLSVSDAFHNKVNLAPQRLTKRIEKDPVSGKDRTVEVMSNDYAYASSFYQVIYSRADLIDHITRGKAYCVAALANNYRATSAFVSAQIIALDFDNAAYEWLLEHPLVARHAFYAGPTASHTDDAPRCRVLFALDRPITDAAAYASMVRRVMSELTQFDPDTATADSVRFFFGAAGRVGYAADAVLPVDLIDTFTPDPQTQPSPRTDAPQNAPTAVYSADTAALPVTTLDALYSAIERALGVTGYRANGWSTPVRCPVHAHEHDDTEPAAHWHRDKHIFKCFKCEARGEPGYRLAKNIAGYMGIEVRTTTGGELHSATREALVQRGHIALARVLDALQATGRAAGSVIDEAYLTALCASVGIGKNSVRQALTSFVGASPTVSPEGLTPDVGRGRATLAPAFVFSTDDEGETYFFRKCHPNRSFEEVHLRQGDKTGKNSKGRKKTYYVIPSEGEVCALLGIDTPRGFDGITIDDLASVKLYRQAMTRGRMKRANGEPLSIALLASNAGVTKRTMYRHIAADTAITTQRTEKVLQEVTADSIGAIAWGAYATPANGYTGHKAYISIGDGHRYAPHKKNAEYFLDRGHSVRICRQLPNRYRVTERSAAAGTEIDLTQPNALTYTERRRRKLQGA